MDTVLYNFLTDVPRAATIWFVLLALAVGAGIALIARPRGTGDSPDAAGSENTAGRDDAGYDVAVRDARRRRERLATRAAELHRYAEEVAVAAERSAVTAQRRRDEWLEAQDRAEKAWHAYEVADTAARRVAAAGVLPEPRTPRTPAEYADRERFLHRAAMAACTRQELSVLQLSDVLANRNGWDPRRHPVEQEIVLRRAVRDSLLAAHATAAERERIAWRDAEVAAAAARSLRDEAFAAASRTTQVRRWLPAQQPKGPGSGQSSRDAARRSRPVGRWRAVRAS